MVTRSQALAKRKAEGQLPEPGSPAKSSKSSSSDDSSTERRKAATSSRPAKAREVGSIGGDESGPDETKQQITTPDSNKSEENNSKTIATDSEKNAPEDQANGSGKEQEHEEEEEEEQEGTPEETPEERAQREKDHADLLLAREVMQQLQLVVERWRLSEEFRMPKSHDDKQLQGIAHLCDLLTTEEDTHRNQFLTRLPQLWWQDMNDLKERLKALGDSRDQLSKATEAFERRSATYDNAVSNRGDSYVGAGDRSQEARQALREAVLAARKPYRDAHRAWRDAQRIYDELKDNAWRMISYVLLTADKALVYEKYLRPWAFDRSIASEEDRNEAEESLRTPTHTRYRSRRGSGDSFRRRGSSSPKDRRPAHDERRRVRSSSQERRPEEDDPVVVEADIIADLHDEQRGELERARAAYERALNKFDAVRNRYYGDLAKFVDQQRRNAVRGTRTDFDHKYYVMRARANREVTAARAAFEAAIEEADMTGALTLGQRVLLFRDEVDSQRGEGENPLTRMLRETSNEHIEVWRKDEAQKDIVSKKEWSALLSEPKQEGDSIVSVDNPEAEERLATGKRRRDIDQWQRQQKRDRTETAFAVLPSMLPKGAEVQWFEGVDGI